MTATVTALAPIEPLHHALALATEAGDIDALKDIHATATALREGARARGMGIGAENQAAEVVLRAERTIGLTLKDMQDRGELAVRGQTFSPREPYTRTRNGKEESVASWSPTPTASTLADFGFTRQQASQFAALARIPDEEFESRFGTVRDSGARIAKVDFYRLVKGKPDGKPEAEREVHGDTFTATYAAFAKASKALVDDIAHLPSDELLALASDIRAVVNAYNAERARR